MGSAEIDINLLTSLLSQIGEKPLQASIFAKGATCDVWRVQSTNRLFALRVFNGGSRVLDGVVDAFIRSSLAARGCAIVAPILNSETTGQSFEGKRWCLEPFITGGHPRRGALSQQIGRRLGETLAALHELPSVEFGRPLQVHEDCIVGQKSNPFEGVAQRFENPLPELWRDGFDHPLLKALPDLAVATLALLRDVSERVREGETVVCHSDIHERQLICSDNRLAALIDFGDASILDRHWDLGSVYYFHGEAIFAAVYDAYSSNTRSAQTCPHLARSFSAAVAMHHSSRSRLPGKSHRLEKATQHIRQLLRVT